MKNKSQKLACISICHPHDTFDTNLVKIHKSYRLAEEINGNTRKTAASEKVKSKIKLTYDPGRKKKRGGKKKKKTQNKKRKKLSYQNACLSLCNFPDYVENAVTAAILLLLVMLSQTADLLVGIVPALPILVLNTPPLTNNPVVRTLLQAIQGPEIWEGEGWSLRRPWIVQPQIALKETKPSTSTIDYIGGKLKDEFYCWRKFCFPFICSSMVFMPGVPPEVSRTIIASSPLALPILFKQKMKVADRMILEQEADNFNFYVPSEIEKLSSHSKRCHQEMAMFLKWFYGKERHFEQWKRDISRFRPVTESPEKIV